LDAAPLEHKTALRPLLREAGLTTRELVGRQRVAADGRRWMIAITPLGRRLVEDTALKTAMILSAYDERFGSDRMLALQAELADLVDQIADLSSLLDAEVSH